MALFQIPNIRLSGISACVPKRTESNLDYDWISEQERALLIKTTGIENRRMAETGVTTGDLCFVAAKKLISELNWKPEEIEIIILVSQSRDYFLPATAIILQDKLGLPKTALAFDLSLGCSGYIYGLSTIASLMSNAKIKKGLLLTGDISTLSLNKKDKSTYPLFGDAGTVTAIEYDEKAEPMFFNLQSDGSGYKTIIVTDGCTRQELNEESYKEVEIEKGVIRNRKNLSLDGLEVFNFSLREVGPNIKELLNYNSSKLEDYDHFVFHQANKLMNETIRKKLKIDAEKVPYTLKQYGNTSSASIPLTIVSELSEKVRTQPSSFILSGFGVGLSWGSAAIKTHGLICPPVIEYENEPL
ncbi:MAG: ketoacyl-ACP synthase III [Bacteroidota bacterium]|nr:ketoacyl-ACP synthase III [Bacteroidota bacterium]